MEKPKNVRNYKSYILLITVAVIGMSVGCSSDSSSEIANDEPLLVKLDSLTRVKIALVDEEELSLLKEQAYAVSSKEGLLKYYNIKSRIDLQKNKLDSALYHINLALGLAEELRDTSTNIFSLILKGNILKRLGSLDQSIEHFYQAFELANATGSQKALAAIKGDLGLVYFDIGDYPSALKYLKEAIAYETQQGSKEESAATFNSLGNVYKKMGEPDSAIYYYNLSIEAFTKEGNDYAIGSLYSNIGLFLTDQNRLDEAGPQFQRALEYMEKIGPNPNYVNVLNAYSGYLIKTENFEEALLIAERAHAMATSSGNKRGQLNSYFRIAEANEVNTNYQQAYDALNAAFDLNDSIFTENLAQSAKESELKFETTLKEQALIISQFKLEQQRKMFFYSIVLIGVLVLLSVFLVIAMIRQKKLTNTVNNQSKELLNKAALLEERNIELNQLNTLKTKLFSIISHDLRSPINNIKSIVELLKAQSPGEVIEPRLFHHLENSVDASTDMINKLLQWVRIQLSGFHPNYIYLNVKDTIKEACESIKDQASQKNIDIAIEIDARSYFITDPDILRIVIYNITQNAIKFTHKGGSVIISTKLLDNHLQIDVRDSGMGMKPEIVQKLKHQNEHVTTYGTSNEKGAGLGLNICRELLSLVDGQLDFESTLGEGTTFTILLPEGELKEN